MKRIIVVPVIFATLVSLLFVQVFAHSAILEAEYDDCVKLNNDDGIDEMWYSLEWFERSTHIGHEIDTIKYYFAENSVTTIVLAFYLCYDTICSDIERSV